MVSRRKRFAQRRKAVGLSQEALADRLGVERSTVIRWESGETEPQPWIRPKIMTELHVSLEQLDELLAEADRKLTVAAGRCDALRAHVPQPENPALPNCQSLSIACHTSLDLPGIIDDMNRREFLRLVTMAGTLVTIGSTESQLDGDHMGYFSDRTARLDLGVADEYAAVNAYLWRLFGSSMPKANTLPLVRKQLDVLNNSFRLPHGPSIHERLCTLVADLFQLAGEIFFDSNLYVDAAQCYALACTASKEAEDFDLWACAMTRHAFTAIYEREFNKAAPMLELAARLAQKGDPALSTKHWVHVVSAQAFAGLGERDLCMRALDLATEVRHLNGQVHNGGWLRFDDSRLAEERGACYVELGRPDLAEAALIDALSQDLSVRRRSGVLIDLATIGAQRRDVGYLVTYAEAALEMARQMRSGVISRRLSRLQTHLAPFLGEGRVSDLNRQIAILSGRSNS